MSNHAENQFKTSDILNMLPGKNTRKTLKTEMLRVDHAGEFGAVHIYRGQEDALKHAPNQNETAAQISEMKSQEIVHLEKFNNVLPERYIRPSVMSPLWRSGGYMMGALTALISPKSAMACTEAVETVIDKHYTTQIDFFEQDILSDLLLDDLKKFQQDELDHKYEAIDSQSTQAPFYQATTTLIKAICHSVIKIAHKV